MKEKGTIGTSPSEMRLLYAAQFEVAPLADSGNPAKRDDVLSVVSSWISEWYLKWKGIEVDLPRSTGTCDPLPSHNLTVTANIARSESVSHTVISWSYPDVNGRNLLWNSRIELAEFGGLTEFSFQVQFDSMQYVIAPVEFRLHRPRIIGAMLRQFSCSCGDTPLSDEPRELGAAAVPDFVQQRVLSRRRRLPIILVSRTIQSEEWLVDPGHMAEQLAGIAETYCLADKWAAFELTNALGDRYRCFNGALRVYWPDFELAQRPHSPFFVPDGVMKPDLKLGEVLFRQLAAISTFRYSTGPVITDAIEHLECESRTEIDNLKVAARDRGAFDELLDLEAQEKDKLLEQNEWLRQQNESLRASLDLAQENFRAINEAPRGTEAEGGPQELQEEEPGPKLRSVEEAVSQAKVDFEGALTFLHTAFNSARNSPFDQPKKAYQAFLAMNEVCSTWRRSLETKTSAGSFEQAFEKKGFVYKQQAKGKWAEEYETIYNGRKVSIEPHLALGKGGPKTCLRIHFYIDREHERFVVAYVGRHKTNTSS